MSSSIRISQKYGLNPCIPVCAFCGKEKHEIAFLGRLKGDVEAPHSAILDYTPCDECQANWNMGIPLIRVTSTPAVTNQRPISKRDGTSLYPTGHYVVMKPEAVKRVFDIDGKVGSPVLVEDKAFDQMMEHSKQADAEKPD